MNSNDWRREQDDLEASVRRANEPVQKPDPLPTDDQNHELNAWAAVDLFAQMAAGSDEKQREFAVGKLRELAAVETARVRKDVTP